MIEYYLKFTSEEEALAALYEQEQEDPVPKYENISVIGTIIKDEVALEGWHVNVKADKSPELEPYRVFPTAPMRVWA